jgi:hypothetical protein
MKLFTLIAVTLVGIITFAQPVSARTLKPLPKITHEGQTTTACYRSAMFGWRIATFRAKYLEYAVQRGNKTVFEQRLTWGAPHPSYGGLCGPSLEEENRSTPVMRLRSISAAKRGPKLTKGLACLPDGRIVYFKPWILGDGEVLSGRCVSI